MEFPLNYFSTIFSAINIFKNRKQLNWGQIILIILLLNGLMIMPLSARLGSVDSANLSDFVPNAVNEIKESDVILFNQFLDNGKLNIPSDTNNEHFVSKMLQAKKMIDEENKIIITNEGFLLKEKNKPLIEQGYIETIALNLANTPSDLVQQLSNHWFQQNRIAIVMTNFFNVWFLMIVNFVTLLLGTAVLFWLTRFGKIFSIHTFFESLQLSLNAFGIPTLFAMIGGFIFKSPNGIILIQSTLYILLLLLVYWKTHFNDQYVKTQLESKKKKVF